MNPAQCASLRRQPDALTRLITGLTEAPLHHDRPLLNTYLTGLTDEQLSRTGHYPTFGWLTIEGWTGFFGSTKRTICSASYDWRRVFAIRPVVPDAVRLGRSLCLFCSTGASWRNTGGL